MASESKLEQLVAYQGRELTEADKRIVKALQESLIEEALREGKATYLKHKNDGKHFFLSPFAQFFKKTCGGSDYLRDPKAFSDAQQMLYKIIHESTSTPDHIKLFFEFLIGLARFVLSVRLQHIFLDAEGLLKNQAESQLAPHTNDLFQALDICGKLLDDANRVMAERFVDTGQEENYWLRIAKFLAQHENYKSLAKALIGLHYIPTQADFITLAQILHWKGWGGTGEILARVFSSDFPNLLRHCIHYISVEQASRFTQIISSVIKPMAQKNDDLLYEALREQTGKIVYLCDIGSGPLSGMVANAVRRFQTETGRSTELDALDICEFASLEDIRRRDIYWDANNMSTRDAPPRALLYDICTAGFVLHQLKDPLSVLRTLLYWTKPGGFVITKQIKPGAHLQFAVVPINLVDREGYVPDYPLEELAIPSADRVKFLCELPNTRMDILRSRTDELEQTVWGLRAFAVIECPAEDFRALVRHNKTRDTVAFNSAIRRYSSSRFFKPKIMDDSSNSADSSPHARL